MGSRPRRPRPRRRHQRRRLGRVPLRPGRQGRASSTATTSPAHLPGVLEPGLGRHQVPRELRVRPGAQALPSRNQLFRSYPSTVQEIRFYAAHERGFRHGRWKLVLGTWLYWTIGGFFTRRPRALSTGTMAREEPVIALAGLDGGFEYSDAFLHDNDARFVWGFVRGALDHGCVAANYVESLASHDGRARWVTRARDVVSGAELSIRSRLLVNACGPYADGATRATASDRAPPRLLQGHPPHRRPAHPHRRVLTFFADDGRLFFVIPMGPRTCIGTTDTQVDRPEVEVTPEDRAFVLSNINKRLQLPRAARPRATSSPSAAACARSP